MGSLSLDNPPLVLRQSRAQLGIGLASALAFAAGAVWLGIQGKWLLGGLILAWSAWISLIVVRALRSQPELIIEPSGLTYSTPLQRTRWLWSDLGTFRLVAADEGQEIVCRLRGLASAREVQGTISVPDCWPAAISEVCDALNAARERWG